MPKVIQISGKMGSGKSTLADNLLELFDAHYLEVRQRAIKVRYADVLYRMHDAVLPIAKSYGLVPEDTTKDKHLLQVLGTEWGRKFLGEDVWVKALREQVRLLEFSDYEVFIVEDCRFPNELLAYPREQQLVVRLHCSRDVRKARADHWRENEDHPSETALDGLYDGQFNLFYDTGDIVLGPKEIAEDVFKEAKEKWNL